VVILAVLVSTVFLLAVPFAGSKIENIASARFIDGDGNGITVFSEKVVTTVLPVYGFIVKPDGTFANPGQIESGKAGATVDLKSTVTNTGNIETYVYLKAGQVFETDLEEETFFKVASSPYPVLRVVGIFHDRNGNGKVDDGEPKIEGIDLPVEASEKIIVRVKVEDKGSVISTGFVNVVGDDMMGNVDDDNIAMIEIKEGEILTFEKTQLNETVQPGGTQKFTLRGKNLSDYSLDTVTVREYIDFNGYNVEGIADLDSIEANLPYAPGYFDGKEWSGTRPGSDELVKGFELTFSNVLAGQEIVVVFDVFFPPTASPGVRFNAAELLYSRAGSFWEGRTNTVEFNIPVSTVPFLGPLGKPQAAEMTEEDTTVSTVTVYGGDSVSFPHTLKNGGNRSGVMDLEIESANFDTEGWNFVFKNTSGEPLVDTDGSGLVDAGVIEPGEERDIVLEVSTPSQASGDNAGKSFRFIPRTVMNGESNRTIDIVPFIYESGKLSLEKAVTSATLLLPGESVRFSIIVKNESSSASKAVVITDEISTMLEEPFDISVSKEATVTYDGLSRILTVEIDSLGPFESVEIFFNCKTSLSLEEGTVVKNVAKLSSGAIGETSNDVSVRIFQGRLEVVKSASPSVVELGSEITYTVEVFNPSSIATVTELRIEDRIPAGTVYVESSATIDGELIEPVVEEGVLHFTGLKELGPGKRLTLLYRLRLVEYTGDSLQNRVLAAGTVLSEEYSAYVTTAPSVVDVKILKPMNLAGGISGRLYVDENGNGYYDEDDTAPLPVRLLLQDGSFAVSDREGLFHFDRLSPGSHVLKIDIDTTPYKLAPLQDSRSLKDGRSYMLAILPGMYTIVDIPLIHREKTIETITFKEPSTLKGLEGASAILSAFYEGYSAGDSSDGYIVFPENGRDFTGTDRITVEVAVPPESLYRLSVNGSQIPDTQIGQKANDLEGRWLFAKYFNVKLMPGANRIRVEWQDLTEKGSAEVQVYLSGEPVEIRVSSEPRVLIADGITEAVLTVSLVDERGIPASVGGTVIVEGLDPDSVLEPGENWDGKRLKLENGVARVKLKPFFKAGTVEFTASYAELSREVRLEYRVESRPPIVTGFGRLQYNLHSKSFDYGGGIFGRFNLGDGLVTFKLGENTYGDYDAYVTHGDASTSGTLAPSSTWYFFRYEVGLFNLQLGDYIFQSEGGQGFASQGTGLSSEYSGDKLSYRLFLNPSYRETRKEELRGQGVRGPYYLVGVPIKNSETVFLVSRDSQGEELTRKLMKRGTDYTLYPNGLLIFTRPVPYYDIDLNEIFIEATYSVDSDLPSEIDVMATLSYREKGWKYSFTGLVKGLLEGYRFASIEVSAPPIASLQPELNVYLSSKDGETGFRAQAASTMKNSFVSGKLEVHIDRQFLSPNSSRVSSGWGIGLELAPVFPKVRLLSGYNYDVKNELGTLSAELLTDVKTGRIFTEISLKDTLIHRQDGLENEARFTLKPSFSVERVKINGEVYAGLKGLSPIAGLSLRADLGLSESLFTGGDLSFGYAGSDRLELSLTPFILKKLGEISLVAKEKIELLPDLRFTTVIGFGYTLDNGKLDLEATLSDKVSLGAGYRATFSPEIVNVDLLIQGRYTIAGTGTEDFLSAHLGIENREIEHLKIRLDTDLKIGRDFKLSSLLIESTGEYLGFESLKPAYRILFAQDFKLQNGKFEVQTGLAYRPDWRTPLTVLFEGAYYINRQKEKIDSEGRLTLDVAYWLDRTVNLSLTGEIYLKNGLLYAVAGLQAEKHFFDLFSLSGGAYLVSDNAGNLYNRFTVEAGFSPLPDTQLYAGYGWGTLLESFTGNLQKSGFYFGVRVKFDDGWFFKNSDRGSLSLLFFRDRDFDGQIDPDETPVRARVKIGEQEYESDENGEVRVNLPAGLYTVDLLEYPGDLISLLDGSADLSVTGYGTRQFNWPFMESPAFLDIRVFVDSNSSGKLDGDEKPLQSFSLSVGEDVLFTTDGTLTVPVTPGNVKVSLDLSSFGDGVSVTSGGLDISLSLKPGERRGIEFGLAFERKVEVVLFRDLNANGLRESDEPLLDASGILAIGGKPFRIGSRTVLEGVPSGRSPASLTMDRGFEKLYSRITTIDTVEVAETGDTVLEIGFAEKSSLMISFLDEKGDYFYDVVTVKIDGIEFQAFGIIELVGLVFGDHLVEVTGLPKGFKCDRYLYEIWLEPGGSGEIEVVIGKE